MDLVLNNLLSLIYHKNPNNHPTNPSPLWPGMEAPDRAPSMGLNRTKLRTYTKLNCLK